MLTLQIKYEMNLVEQIFFQMYTWLGKLINNVIFVYGNISFTGQSH